MSQKDVGSHEAARRRQIVSDRIEKVAAACKGQPAFSKEQAADFLTSNSLATALFSKAPIEFLESRTVEDLVEIASHTALTLGEFQRSQGLLVRGVERSAGVYGLAVVMDDCPFIVNTIGELLAELRAKVTVFLHPIVTAANHRISVSYLECKVVQGTELGALEAQISAALTALGFITTDYDKMTGSTSELAGRIATPSSSAQSEGTESAAFLRWLSDGGLVFLGQSSWKVSKGAISGEPCNPLGLLSPTSSHHANLLQEIALDTKAVLSRHHPVLVAKLGSESPVHRRKRIMHIVVREQGPDNAPLMVHSIIGLLTSKALAEESSNAPLIREKARAVVEQEGLLENTHDFKLALDVIDHMPKDEALRFEVPALLELIRGVIELQNSREGRALVYLDSPHRGVTAVVLIPRDRFNNELAEELRSTIERTFQPYDRNVVTGVCDMYADIGSKTHVRLYFSCPIGSKVELSPGLIEAARRELSQKTQGWYEQLATVIRGSTLFSNSEQIVLKYQDAFPTEYRTLHSIRECEADIEAVERFTGQERFKVGLSFEFGHKRLATGQAALTVYARHTELTLSHVVPKLENLGLEVISERSSTITPHGVTPVHVHQFLVRAQAGTDLNRERFDTTVSPGLEKLLDSDWGNDPLNSLMLHCGLSFRAVQLLRSYCYLLWQVDKSVTRRTVITTLAGSSKQAGLLWQIFETLFDPMRTEDREVRRSSAAAQVQIFRDGLREIRDITKDRVLRSLLQLLEGTVRTNFFQGSATIALKLRSDSIEIMPHPRPKFEIFVVSPTIEGTHLRSGMVARGGIRWSDRYEDYRTEVLGLMKTQRTKNVLIVPTGAKGGFVVRNLPTEQPRIAEAVEQGYKEYVRALLSITDNRDGDQILPPANVVRYDGDDPYLVVAADKGTATFSDAANRIAVQEYNFWLADAFASGGSNGYDHKLYAITAKGAWECVKRHFSNIGLNYEDQPFTVIGIGDMAGDVFGNGLILSSQMKLVGAFNHKHIFIDPTPDPSVSFQERLRLFQTKGSQWSDYSTDKLSPGGAVYLRSDKEIKLSAEARRTLQVPTDAPEVLSGEEVITHILRAPADLLWNGGIGTYVKASSESNADVNDSANDRVRVSASELRCRVVGEGGNLGFTQRARIEFHERGGLNNTDAIDNSGGVDLSDHEVNLKILFANLMRDQKITLSERNSILKEMAPQVVEDVLTHNRGHALTLTFAVERSKRSIEYFQSLIRQLVKNGYLNRHLENLPDDEDLSDRVGKNIGLARPELAICLAAVKMWVKEVFLASSLPQEQSLLPLLVEYFPTQLRTRFPAEVKAHPLAKYIVATQVTNMLHDVVGITFVHRTSLTRSVQPETTLRALLAAYLLLDVPGTIKALQPLDQPRTAAKFLELRADLAQAVRETTVWLIGVHGQSPSLDDLIRQYRTPIKNLLQNAGKLFVGDDKELLSSRREQLLQVGMEHHTLELLSAAPRITALWEILWASKASGKEEEVVASVYARVLSELKVHEFLKFERSVPTETKWDQELVSTAVEDVRWGVSSVTRKILDRGITSSGQISQTVRGSASWEQLKGALDDLHGKLPSAAAFSVIGKKFREFTL